MLRYGVFAVAILTAAVAAGIVPSQSPKLSCPASCNCSDVSTASCNSLDLEAFGQEIYSLRILRPKEQLVLKGDVFKKRGLQNVNSIHIENAVIKELDKSAFAGLVGLSSFTIVNSTILSVGTDAFELAYKLRILKISSTPLSTAGFVSSSLEELELSSCALLNITNTTFVNLPQLTYLNVASNNISFVDPVAFSELTNLEELTLEKNSISSLSPGIFENNVELVTLDISSNPLKTFNAQLASDLETLILKSCNLQQFNGSFDDLDLLTHLDLSNNSISDIPSNTFDKMEELEYIDLSSNKLTSLNADVFRSNSKLQKIILDNNNLRTLPKFVTRAEYFETYYFSCNNCSLSFLDPKSFMLQNSIVILNLSNNKLQKISPDAFKHLPSLIELDVSYNNIAHIDKSTFSNLSALEKLNLAGNPLGAIDINLFSNTRSLKYLNLHGCALRQLWRQPVVGKISSLVNLNLASNTLKAISQVELRAVPNLQVLDLTNNQLECSPTVRDAMTWLTGHEVAPASTVMKMKGAQHLDYFYAVKFENEVSAIDSWKQIIKNACKAEDYYDDEYDDATEAEENKPVTSPPPAHTDPPHIVEDYADDNYNYLDEDSDSDSDSEELDSDDENAKIEAAIDFAQLEVESRQRETIKSRYSYFWPTMVFIFTALSVLFVAANIMLLMLRTRVAPRGVNLPHIKIPQWGTNGKVKNHSGSVYQALSEDISGSRTPIINRYEKLSATPAPVHSRET